MDTISADVVNFLLKFMYLAIYQYIAKNKLSTKLSTYSLLTFYLLSTKIARIWDISRIYVLGDACSGYG